MNCHLVPRTFYPAFRILVGAGVLALGTARVHAQAENPSPGVTFDFSGQARLRYERDVGFTLKGYQPGAEDDLLLERVRLDFSARLWNRPRLFLQLQDAHAFLTTLEDSDFPASNPIEDTLDIRQLYGEWERIGGSALGFRIGRQQISYGDQRVFGPGNWGNTGRFAWDAATLKVDTRWFWSDVWVGKYLQVQVGRVAKPFGRRLHDGRVLHADQETAVPPRRVLRPQERHERKDRGRIGRR